MEEYRFCNNKTIGEDWHNIVIAERNETKNEIKLKS